MSRHARAGVDGYPSGRYSDAYANNQFRAPQQFFKWHATEDSDELSEPARLAVADASPANREATVTGKGDNQRTVRFTYDTSRALHRYLRERVKHRLARVPALWLGVRGGSTTASGSTR